MNTQLIRIINVLNRRLQIVTATVLFSILAVLSVSQLYAQVTLVKKIFQPNSTNTYPYEFRSMIVHKGNLFFLFNEELWKSDGTPEGTTLIKRVPGTGEIVSAGPYIYFTSQEHENGQDPVLGLELWRSDGTTPGTTLVKDINPGSTGSNPRYLTDVNGTLFFVANNGTNGYELWKSNGTINGTVLVKDILRVSGNSNPQYLTALNGKVYFRANDGMRGYELWRSDGTDAGTVIVKDINPGYRASSSPEQIIVSNNLLYFFANDGVNGKQLWRSNGGIGVAFLVKVIRPGGFNAIDKLTKVNKLVFFQANDGIHGTELWRSNGTAAGTFIAKDITPGPGSAINYATEHIEYPRESNGKLFFLAVAREFQDLWVSSGTNSGSYPITSMNNPGFAWTDHGSTPYNGETYFAGMGNDENSFLELWKTDGTVAGTTRVHENIGDGYYNNLMGTVLNGKLYFIGKGELWQTDGTPAGTLVVKIFDKERNSDPSNLTAFNGDLVFSATEHVFTRSLWRTNGTEAGTEKIGPLLTGINGVTNINGTLFFSGRDSLGEELWKSDGTYMGTRLVKDIANDPFGWNQNSSPHGFTAFNGEVYFSAQTAYHSFDLWKSDGTAEGTRSVDPAHPSARQFANPAEFTVAGSKLFFTADSPLGNELHVYDGINNPTLVRDIKLHYLGSHPIRLTPFNNILYFQADNRGNGYELFRSDGTRTGTYIVKDIRVNDLGSGEELAIVDMGDMVATSEALYFLAIRHNGKNALWKSDGSAAGTRPFFEITGSPLANILAVDGNSFLFTLGYGYDVPMELWKSNGTAEGTVKIEDLEGLNFNYGNRAKSLTGVHYFIGYTETGSRIWRTDGTAEGTYQIQFDGTPYQLGVAGGKVYLSGDSFDYGSQLFVIDDDGNETLANARLSTNEFVEETDSDELSSYPNPFSTEFTLIVKGERNNTFQLTVLNLNGATVLKNQLASDTPHQLGQDWTAGIYILQINNGNKLITRKVLKTK